LFEPGKVAGVPVGMIDRHADVEPPARKIAESTVAPSEPKLQPRTALPSMGSRNISPFRAPLLLAACAIIVASFAIGIGIGRSYWRRHASTRPNTAAPTVAQRTSVTPAPVTPSVATPPSITPAPKTSLPNTPTPSQNSSGAVGTNGATPNSASRPTNSASPAPVATVAGKKDDVSPAVTAASVGMLVTPSEGDTPLRVDLPEEAVLVSAPLEIRSQRFAYVPGMGTNHHGKVRKERLIIGELESPKTPQIPTPSADTPSMQSGERIVTVRATIDGDGHVTYVDPLSGPIVLIPNVMTAVREWHYKPSSLDGQPVQTEADLTIKFRTTR
jgi:Gram-negative bacterial TonB protein C-terminal